MGRELRRVPPTWQHPKRTTWHPTFGEREEFQPLYDQSFEEVFDEWHTDLHKWLKSEHQYQQGEHATTTPATTQGFTEYFGRSPDPEYYRPSWSDDERTAYQVYENVSEGTPVSPVFDTRGELVSWLRSEWGLSSEGAEKWAELGWSPSLVVTPNKGVQQGYEMYDG